MIQVQIASRLTPAGVDGVRWVLVDDSDAPAEPDAAPAEAAWTPAQQPSALNPLVLAGAGPVFEAEPEVPVPRRLPLALVTSLLMGASFGAAIWVAQANFGPPTARWLQTTPTQPDPKPPGAAVLPAAPESDAPAASAPSNTLTAKAP